MSISATTLLALLAANDNFGQPEVHRTALMKQAYLVETMRPLYRIWRRTFSFVRYRYGPFSDEVFQRLDNLIFNGFVTVTTFAAFQGRYEARYRITGAGRTCLKHIGLPEMSELAMDLIWALQSLGVDQGTKITKLVYQEAEFARLLKEHTVLGIGAESKVPLPQVTDANNATLVALSSFQSLSRGVEPLQQTLSTRAVVRLFLSHLALSQRRATTSGRHGE